MPDPRPDIDPRPVPEIIPQPEPPQPQPIDPVPPRPQETPPGAPPAKDPGRPFPQEIPADPGHDPARDHRPEPVPAMPSYLPISDAENPHSTSLRHDPEDRTIDPRLPAEPGNDINP